MIRCAEACQSWTSSPVPAGRLRDLDVSTDVFAGIITYANLPCVHCLSADPASVEKEDDGRLVRPLFVFEAPRQAHSLWPCIGSTQQSEHQPLPLHQSHLVGIQLAMRYSVGENVPDECRFAGGIDKGEWDFDGKMNPSTWMTSRQLSFGLQTDQLQPRDVRLSALIMRISCAITTASRKHRLAAGVRSLDTMRRPARPSQ